MEKFMSIKEAAKHLGMPEKHLSNFIKIGGEIPVLKIGRRICVSQKKLEIWFKARRDRILSLDKDDYLKCLEFALKSFYAYKSTADFGTVTQRGAGKFVDDFVIGKLGEIAFAKFLKAKFDIDVKLDFSVRGEVVGQDIAEISRPRRGPRVFNPPNIRIAVKATKGKNVWLMVPKVELEDPARYSDAYVFVRVDLQLNHVFRFLRDQEVLKSLKDEIPAFEPIVAEVAGFAWKEDLSKTRAVTELPSPRQKLKKPNYVMRSGDLRKSSSEWQEFVEKL